MNVLTINGGSSSIRFAVFLDGGERSVTGKIERIGLPDALFSAQFSAGNKKDEFKIAAPDFNSAGAFLLDWLAKDIDFSTLAGIGHRIVHGGAKFSEPQRIDDAVLAELRAISPYDPEHLPAEIALVELFRQRLPNLPQVACFDTAFHRTLPAVARILPIPRRYFESGVQRYGFHGLSYTYLMQELERLAGRAAAQGRVILAHFGNGASLAAVKDGQCIDTSMGFTPTAGMPMGTRSGSLDPGLVYYLARTEQMTAEQFEAMVNHESGLKGVSETGSDMRDLIAKESTDPRAKEAVDLFCYEARKWIGAFVAVLGGLDTLVFAGGIGEHGHEIRERICQNLKHLGIELEAQRNKTNAPLISKDASPVAVRVIPTDEEIVIAKATQKIASGG